MWSCSGAAFMAGVCVCSCPAATSADHPRVCLAEALTQASKRLCDATTVLEGPEGLGRWKALHAQLVARRNRLVSALGEAFQVRRNQSKVVRWWDVAGLWCRCFNCQFLNCVDGPSACCCNGLPVGQLARSNSSTWPAVPVDGRMTSFNCTVYLSSTQYKGVVVTRYIKCKHLVH